MPGCQRPKRAARSPAASPERGEIQWGNSMQGNGNTPPTGSNQQDGGATPPEPSRQPGFRMTPLGLYWDSAEEHKPAMWLSPPFEIVAHTRNPEGKDWGLLLRWYDLDNVKHEWAMPYSALGGGSEEIWRTMLAGGLRIMSTRSGREKLAQYLSTAKSSLRVRGVERTGWYIAPPIAAFVLPDKTFGESAYERIRWQSENPGETLFREAGSPEEWRREIGRRCIRNSLLVTCVSAAFAAPLLRLAEEPGGGLHFFGPSRLGKTTLLRVGGSVWGGGRINGYLRSWRTTGNSLEATAEAHCDSLLCLDEFAEVNAREAGGMVYMLANGSGKGRGRRDGSARRVAQWIALFLSSGEIALADKIAEEGNKRTHAGQEVRFVDVAADAGAGHGVFENLHGAAHGGELAEQLCQASLKYYGTPIRSFLELLVQWYGGDLQRLVDRLKKSRDDFLGRLIPNPVSGQVRSVCSRFALIAAGGELATEFGITGWPEGEAERAAETCVRAWLKRRGTTGDQETEAGIRQLRAFIEAYGDSRFFAAWEDDPERVTIRAGYRKCTSEGWEYFILPEQWQELTRGFDSSALAFAMIERGLMKSEKDENGKRISSIRVTVRGGQRIRAYHVLPKILLA
jgi:putative DNA primase/helicase